MPKAGVKVSGLGPKKLRALGVRLENLQPVKRRIAAAQSEEVIDLINDGFKIEADPYGRRWKRRKRETKLTRGRKVLSGQTSRLQRGWHRTALSADGFRISASVEYAIYHQSPRKGKRPKRAMVPSENRGFPSKWRKPLTEVAIDAVTDFLTGK